MRGRGRRDFDGLALSGLQPLPDNSDRVGIKGAVAGQDCEAAHESLGDQHAVKRILVKKLEFLSSKSVRFGEGKTGNAGFLAYSRNELI